MHQQNARGSSVSASTELTDFAERAHVVMSCCGARVRIEILAHLCCAPVTVGTLASALNLDHTLVSKYLKALQIGGFVQMRRLKNFHEYRLSDRVHLQAAAEGIELSLPVKDAPALKLVFPKVMLTRLLAEHPRSGSAAAVPQAQPSSVAVVRPRPGDVPWAIKDDATRARRPGEH